MNTVQSGDAQAIGEDVYTVQYTNATVLMISVQDHDTWMSFSHAGLNSAFARFTILKRKDTLGEGPYVLTIPFSSPSTGTLFFASSHVSETSFVEVVQMGGIN